MKAHRFALLLGTFGCLTLGATVPSAGCNGTGTTPMCDFPDGANNPESGCGVLVEAAAPSDAPPIVDAPLLDSVAPLDSPPEKTDASDATVPDAADAHAPAETGTDSGDAHVGDAKSDAVG